MICRGTDISKYFRESLGLQDSELIVTLCLSIALDKKGLQLDILYESILECSL